MDLVCLDNQLDKLPQPLFSIQLAKSNPRLKFMRCAGTTGMPLLVLLSCKLQLKGITFLTVWIINPALSHPAQVEMSVDINVAHVRLGNNSPCCHSLSLALLVLQKVQYH